jgi:serine/threonine-protein kinase ATR
VTLVGSDGRHYIFLAKPKDDLRKDNRMMEAAGVVNRLFVGDPAARRRNLYLRWVGLGRAGLWVGLGRREPGCLIDAD